MIQSTHGTENTRSTVLAAICTADKAARQRCKIQNTCMTLLREEAVDAPLPEALAPEFERRGLSWSVELNDIALSPFGYVPAFHEEARLDPEKWPDSRGLAVEELIYRLEEPEDEEEREEMLAAEEEKARAAIDAAQAAVDVLHEIIGEHERFKNRLRALEQTVIVKLGVPFVGFRRGDEDELYALFEEDGYVFHMPVHLDEETGIDEVDDILYAAGSRMPALLDDDAIDTVSTAVNEREPEEMSEEEAIAIIEAFLAA